MKIVRSILAGLRLQVAEGRRQMAYHIGEVGSQCRGKGPADHRTVLVRRSVGGDEVTDGRTMRGWMQPLPKA